MAEINIPKGDRCPFASQDMCSPACKIYDEKEKTCPLVIIARELRKLTNQKKK